MPIRKDISNSLKTRIPWTLNRIIMSNPRRLKLWNKWFSCQIKLDKGGIFHIRLIRRSDDESALSLLIILESVKAVGQFILEIGNSSIACNTFPLTKSEYGDVPIDILLRHFLFEYLTTTNIYPFVNALNEIEPGFNLDLSITPIVKDHPFIYYVKTKKQISKEEKFEHSTLLTSDIFE